MKIALIYDFDGTLSPGNMQEYDFIPSIGMGKEEFWKRCQKLAEDKDADPILTYMSEMIRQANNSDKPIRRSDFVGHGKNVRFFNGVETWFERINEYATSRGIEVEHYINSSGIKEMIEGTSIASHFKNIYACSFLYDANDVAYWPAVAVNYTNKTQFMFKINKGIEAVSDDKMINKFQPEEQRPIPFRNMIYIGDGSTDIPCMRLVKEKLGNAIAVYNPEDEKIGNSLKQLIDDDRVNFIAPADYSRNSMLDEIVKTIIDKLAAENRLSQFKSGLLIK